VTCRVAELRSWVTRVQASS